jgi:hypothetical protein
LSSSLQQYSLLYFAINGALLTEEASMSIKRASKATLVETVAKGFSGVSPGAAMCQGSINNVIPASGLEFDAGPGIIALQVYTFKAVRSDGKGCVFQGFILDDDASHGVNQNAKYDLNWVGQYPLWQ